MYYGIVLADDMEYAPFAKFAATQPHFSSETFFGRESVAFFTEKGSKVRALYSKVGKVNAAAATAFLIADGVDIVINSGLSGALNGDSSNRLILAESSFESDFDLTALGYEPFAKPLQEHVYKTTKRLLSLSQSVLPEAVTAPITSGDLFLVDREKSEWLYRQTGAEAYDMESAAVASVCRQTDTPFILLRQISDGADENTAVAYRHTNEHDLHRHLEADMRIIRRLEEEEA